jgi:drug/metabolite transporter (DMT)-like permease
MSDISLDFTGVFIALGIGAFAALLATPLCWRLAAGLPRPRRAVLALLGGLGVAGLAAAYFSAARGDRELTAFAIGATLALQTPVLPVLLLLSRKGA